MSIYTSNKILNQLSSSTNFRLVVQSSLLAMIFTQSRPFVTVFYEELLDNPNATIRNISKRVNLPIDRVSKSAAVISKRLQHQIDISATPAFKYFSDVIDNKNILLQEEYRKYCEIYWSSTNDKNIRIDELNKTPFKTLKNKTRRL